MLLINLHPLNIHMLSFFVNKILPLFWNLQYFTILDTFLHRKIIFPEFLIISSLECTTVDC